MRTDVVAARCPAKVNLQLSVGPRMPDGFHGLVTVFHAVSLYDEVRAQRTAGGSGIRVTLSSDRADVPTDSTNLAWRAASALAEHLGVEADVDLQITKSIPVAGGMAGGSADAAATLVACAALWEADPSELPAIGAALGSDVPFCLTGGTALGTGRGDALTPVLTRAELWWVVAVATGGLSTPAVYAEFDRLEPSPPEPVPDDRLLAALRTGDPVLVGKSLSNDLQRAATSLRPSLQRTLDAAEDAGALGAIVSGSGPSCVLLARTEEHALDLAVSMTSSGTCSTVIRARGSVPGAHLI